MPKNKRRELPKHIRDELDELLAIVDDECVQDGKPILSCLVTTNDGVVSPQFFRSVERYKMRLEGESDDACHRRIVNLCYAFYKSGGMPKLAELLNKARNKPN